MNKKEIKKLIKRIIKSGVYIINEKGRNRYKIGYSEDIDERLKQLQTGNSDILLIYDYFPTDDLSRIENIAKKYADINNIHGEWFELTENALINLCTFIKKTIISEPIQLNKNITVKITTNKMVSDKYNCNLCEFKSNRKTDYTRHTQSKKHLEKISQINSESNSNTIEIEHQFKNEFACMYCNNKYSTQSNRSKHMKKCSNKVIIEKDKIIKDQVKTFHDILSATSLQIPDEKPYECDSCHVKFARLCNLSRHMKICNKSKIEKALVINTLLKKEQEMLKDKLEMLKNKIEMLKTQIEIETY